jgi:hypothetical protein
MTRPRIASRLEAAPKSRSLRSSHPPERGADRSGRVKPAGAVSFCGRDNNDNVDPDGTASRP